MKSMKAMYFTALSPPATSSWQTGAKIAAIAEQFHAMACEMEGGSIGHVCYMNQVPFAVLRTISDNGNNEAVEDFPQFAREAADRSIRAAGCCTARAGTGPLTPGGRLHEDL